MINVTFCVVSGTFNGLAEGAVIVANGVSYQISYVGGTGNDVALTVTSVSAVAPNTGLNQQSPLLYVLGGLGAKLDHL